MAVPLKTPTPWSPSTKTPSAWSTGTNPLETYTYDSPTLTYSSPVMLYNYISQPSPNQTNTKEPTEWADEDKSPTEWADDEKSPTEWANGSVVQVGYLYDSPATYDSDFTFDFTTPAGNQTNDKTPTNWTPSA